MATERADKAGFPEKASPVRVSPTRREFLRGVGAAAVATGAAGWFHGAGGAPLAEGKAAEKKGSGKERIGIGVIGCGGRAGSHMNVLTQLKAAGEKVDIVAVCDVYRGRLDKAAKRTAAKPYRDAYRMLEDPAVDAVCIATPDHIHAEHALAAVRAGKDVYCEKPITHWRQSYILKTLAHEAKDRGCVFQLGTQGMSDSIWHQAADIVREGAIGKPIHAQTGFFRLGDWGEAGMPIDDPNARPGPDLDWEAFLGDSPKRSFDVSRFFRWRLYWDYAGGPSTDLFPHTYTPIANLLGVGFPKSVVASGGKYRYNHEREVPDNFNMLIEYPEGVSVAILCTLANAWPIPTVIRGWDGTMTFEGPGLAIHPQGGKDAQKREVARERGASELDFWKNFLRCVRTREKTWSGIELAYQVQTALIMSIISYREERVVHFDPKEEKILMD